MSDKGNEIKECFTLYDRDSDGKIAIQELGTVIRSLGQNPTEAEIDEIKRNIIKNSSFGLADLMQVMSKYGGRTVRDKQDEIRDAFKVFDRDGIGAVSANELRHVMTTIGEKLTDEEMDEIIREVEIDNDGQINYEDIIRILCSI